MPKVDVRKLFRDRMKREGREAEWKATLQAEMDKGLKFGQATWPAMRACGYTDPETERALAAPYEEVPRDDATFWTQRDLLPDRADPGAEINWVMGHKAMLKRARDKTNHKDILLTAADILGPPKCPSKAALTLLQHWCNTPTKLYDQLLSEAKKQVAKSNSGDDGKQVVEDLELAEVERLLKEVTQ